MGRRKKGSSLIDGAILIDKPVGVTSHDVVSQVRRILGTRQVGHCGTLDPLASGLMVLLIGDGTKLSRYILEDNKGYELEFELGRRTDTLDVTGTVTDENPVDISQEILEKSIESFSGNFDWRVPLYSAVKINGKKLYEYAREGIEVEVPIKTMKFWDVQTLEVSPTGGKVALTCSKGSYVRSWVDELGQKLGCGAVLTNLRRTLSFPYEISQAVTLETLKKEMDENECVEHLSAFIPMSAVLPHWKTCSVSGHSQTLLCNGQISSDLKGRLGGFVNFNEPLPGVKVVSGQGHKLLALLHFTPGQGFQIGRVFN